MNRRQQARIDKKKKESPEQLSEMVFTEHLMKSADKKKESREQISQNKEAERIVGKRKGTATPLFFPMELGFVCPICGLLNDESKDLQFSEYEGFMWCPVCNLDIPSCLCKQYSEPFMGGKPLPKKDAVLVQTKIFLDCVKDVRRNERKNKEEQVKLLKSKIESNGNVVGEGTKLLYSLFRNINEIFKDVVTKEYIEKHEFWLEEEAGGKK